MKMFVKIMIIFIYRCLKKINILKHNHREKSMKHSLIYLTLSLYLKKIDQCHNNSKRLSTAKVNKHTACGYSLFKHCSFDI